MSVATFLAYGTALLVAALIPGPGMTAIVARALGGGVRPAVFMGLGLIVGDLSYFSTVCFGFAYVAQTLGTVFLVVKYLGAAYLAFLAWKLWRQGLLSQDIEGQTGGSGGGAFLSGLLVTLGNPKTMLFYLALLPTLLPLDTMTTRDYLLVSAGSVVVLTVALVPYIFLAARARAVLRRPAALKVLNRAAAGTLAGTAAYISIKAA